MKCVLDNNDSKTYKCLMESDNKTTNCNTDCCLSKSWPKKEDYIDIKDYLIDCCKCCLYFRNCCLCCAMSHCISINQRLSSNYCSK
jgi:hypothetical protein